MGQHPAEFLTGRMALIELQNISKSYDGELVLDEFEDITQLAPNKAANQYRIQICAVSAYEYR